MAGREVAVDVGSWKQRTPTSERSSSKKWRPTMKELTDPNGTFFLKWKRTFIISCLFAVLSDPLFFYIPRINDDIKCMSLDRNLKIAALVFRSVTDIFYIVNIVFHVYISENCATLMNAFRSGSCSSVLSNLRKILPLIAKTMWKLSILLDVLAVLPLPQVAILIFFSKMGLVKSFNTRKLVNFLVMVQYVPRVFRIYLSCKEPKASSKEEIATWVKGVLNFFMYILASHVLGACWYFLAVQRIISCWQDACQHEDRCEASIFDCQDHHTSRNMTSLNDLCPIDSPDEKIFNFGIYLDALQSGILASTDYPKKLSNCFWWGLRNLSSLGSSLETSTETWENLFATLISILGLLLFLYLIGNLQMYMQTDAAILESNRHKRKVKRALEKKALELDSWLLKNGIPRERKNEIMERIRQELAERRNVDVGNILSILPEELQSYIKNLMPLARLKKESCSAYLNFILVPMLQNMNEEVLRAIWEHLTPKRYDNVYEYHSKEGEPLEKMIFIVEGDLGVERRNDTKIFLYPGAFYGAELLEWVSVSSTSFPATLPLSIDSAYNGVVDSILILTAEDLKKVVSRFRSHFSKEITVPSDSQSEVLISFQLSKLKTVPPFQAMDDEDMLRAICERLKIKTYNDGEYIIKEDEPLELMFIVLAGYVVTESYPHVAVRIGELCGKELLDWPSTKSFPAILPKSVESARANGFVKGLALMCDDWVSIVNNFKFGSHKRRTKLEMEKKIAEFELWLFKSGVPSTSNDEIIEKAREVLEENMNVSVENIPSFLPKELQDFIISCLPVNRLKKVPMLQTMNEEVLRAICEHLTPKKYDHTYEYHSRDGEPLEKMIFIVEGDLGVERRNDSKIYLYPGDFYGAELLEWVSVSSTSFPATLPLSIDSAYNGVVDGILILTAENLKKVVTKFRQHFSKEITLPSNSRSEVLSFQMTMLKTVSQFQDMDEEMLKAICERLKPLTYMNRVYITITDEPLQLMFFVLAGYVVTESYPRVAIRIGEFCGQELLDWPSSVSFPAVLPKAVESARANGFVRVLALTSNDWISVVNEFSFGMNKRTIKLEIEKKVSEFKLWLFKSGVPSSRNDEIIQRVRNELEENRDIDVENILSILPGELQSFIRSNMPVTRLRKVPMLQTMEEEVLRAISEHLIPKKYNHTYEYHSKAGKPLEKMIFIVEGDLGVEKDDTKIFLYPGDFYGAELLEWVSVSSTSFPATLPLSIDSAYNGLVDSILILTAEDLKKVVYKFRSHFSKEITVPSDSQSEVLISFQLSMLKTVPPFQEMDGEKLRAVCERLKIMTFTDGEYIIEKNEPLQLMFFLLAGYVVTESYPPHVAVIRIGEFCGQELLDWPSTTSFPATLPTAFESARANGDVRVLALLTEDWVRVVNEYSKPSASE